MREMYHALYVSPRNLGFFSPKGIAAAGKCAERQPLTRPGAEEEELPVWLARKEMPRWVLNVLLAARKASWGRVLAAIVWLRDSGGPYWERLTSPERREILRLARKSRGRRVNLTKREQKRMVALLKAIRRHPAGIIVERKPAEGPQAPDTAAPVEPATDSSDSADDASADRQKVSPVPVR
jgi:hypothetical protein